MSQILNTVNECDEPLPLPVTKNVLECDFRFSTFLSYEKNVTLKPLSNLLLSEIGNNVIIARCFHPQATRPGFWVQRASPERSASICKIKVTSQLRIERFAAIIFCVDILSMLHLLWQLLALLFISNMTRCIPKGRRWLREA